MERDEQVKSQFGQSMVQMAAFRVGEEQYVVDIMRIREIINPLRITSVPSKSELVEGVINLRGAIIPIVDLRKRFAIPEKLWAKDPKYIIVVIGGEIVGIIVDEVLDVVQVSRGAIKPSPQIFSDRNTDLFLGVCEHNGRLLLLIDLKKALSPALARVPIPDDEAFQSEES